MKNLQGQSLPATSRDAGQQTRIGPSNKAEMFFNVRNEFSHYRITIRTSVGGVDGVGIVVERCWVLEGDNDEAREVVRNPGLIKLGTAFGHCEFRASIVAVLHGINQIELLVLPQFHRLAPAATLCIRGKV